MTFTQDYILTESTISSENKGYEIGLTTASTILGAIGGLVKGTAGVAARPKITKDCPDFTNLDIAINDYTTYISDKNVPYNLEAYQTAKSYYLKKVEKEFAEAFYKKSERLFTVKFSFDAANTMINGSTAFFKLDTATGVIEINSSLTSQIKSTTPDKLVYATATGTKWYSLQMTKQTDDVFTQVNSQGITPANVSGLVYNIPGTAIFSLVKPDNKGNVLTNIYKIAQFGTTGSLNPRFTKASVTLDPVTGSLLKASGESKSVATSNITGIGDLFTKSFDTFKKPTEVEELEKQLKILDLRSKIKELESKQ